MVISTSYRLDVEVIVELIHIYSMRTAGGLGGDSLMFRLVCPRCKVVKVYLSIWTFS